MELCLAGVYLELCLAGVYLELCLAGVYLGTSSSAVSGLGVVSTTNSVDSARCDRTNTALRRGRMSPAEQTCTLPLCEGLV